MSDFNFEFVDKIDKQRCSEIKSFIEHHEWLGKMPARPTHRFIASYKGILSGVVVMATPNSFSNLLGKENRHLEKLISRGACISWSPKNLASALIVFSIRWMVKNSDFRFFTSYSDTEAKELGTIYQACNFIYLGQSSGARDEFFDPMNPSKGWFSDRQFRKMSQIKRYAKESGIFWQSEWSSHDKIHWDQIPTEIANQLKQQAKGHRDQCQRRLLPTKHKYVYILGSNKSETKKLKGLFVMKNPTLRNIVYPKIRGPYSDTAANFQKHQENILTEVPETCRPHGQCEEPKNSQNQYLTIKEAAQMMRLSEWSIYNMIKTDKMFPCLNVGVKKKFVIDRARLTKWLQARANERSLA